VSDACWIPVARASELAAGEVVAIRVGDREVALGRDGERYFATQRRCPHHGADLADGIIARGHLVCPQHGWRFCTVSGELDVSPSVCLEVFPLRVVDGIIQVDHGADSAKVPACPTT